MRPCDGRATSPGPSGTPGAGRGGKDPPGSPGWSMALPSWISDLQPQNGGRINFYV